MSFVAAQILNGIATGMLYALMGLGLSLVTGILSIICCGSFIFGIAAVILGFLGRKEINESNGAKKGAGMAMAGLILGAVGIAVSLLYWILVIAGGFDGYYG